MSLQKVILKKLEGAEFEVLAVRSADEAFAILEKGGVEFIWLDHYLLGHKNGFDVVMRVKEENSPWKNTPIFIISNSVDNGKIDAYMRLGVQKYYTKSGVSINTIIDDMREILEKG